MSCLFVIFVFLFVVVDCSVEEVNKLRSEWRDKVREYQEIQNENRKLRDALVIENAFHSKLSKIKVLLEQVIIENDGNLYEKDISWYRERKGEALKEFEMRKKRAEKKFEDTRKLLLEKEVDFERLGDSEYFVKSFDFILKNSLMAPVPKFPEIYAQSANDLKMLHKMRSKLIGLEKFRIEKQTGIYIRINSKIDEIKREFKKFNMKEMIRDNFEMLKMRLMTMNLKDEETKKKLLNYIELYRKNEIEEMDLMEKKNINESTSKLKQYVDYLISTDQWKLRVGHGIVDDNASDVKVKSNASLLIDNKITNTSRLAADKKEKELQYIQLIKYNDSEKMKYVAMIGENKIYKFMVKKYAKMVEGMHKYLVKADDKNGKSIYTEVIEDLVQ